MSEQTTTSSTDIMTPGRAESLMQLAEAAWRDFNTRRSYEWKVNFSLWTALGAFGGFSWDKSIDRAAGLIAYGILAAIALIYVFVWTRGMHMRNYWDYHRALYYWREADRDIRGDRVGDEGSFEIAFKKHPKTPPSGWDHITNWSHGTQIGATLLFVFLAGTALSIG